LAGDRFNNLLNLQELDQAKPATACAAEQIAKRSLLSLVDYIVGWVEVTKANKPKDSVLGGPCPSTKLSLSVAEVQGPR